MLYERIFRIEEDLKEYGFNRFFMSADDIIKIMGNLGIIVEPDRNIEKAVSFITPRKKRKVTLYNYWMHPDELTLVLGHELGHWLLGHIDCQGLFFSESSLFARSGIEKDAGVIGFLCWCPTPWLEKKIQEGCLEPGELAWELKCCDTEWDRLVEYVKGRLRIYRAWKWKTISEG